MRLLWALVWVSVSTPMDQIAQAQTARATQSGHIYRVGEASAPTVLQKNEPEFPIEACKAVLQAAYKSLSTTVGTVTLSLVVGSNGRAQDLKVTRPLGFGLDQQAVQAIRTWRFKPAMKDGKAVPVHAIIDVNFGLPEKCFPARTSAGNSK